MKAFQVVVEKCSFLDLRIYSIAGNDEKGIVKVQNFKSYVNKYIGGNFTKKLKKMSE